MKNGDRESVGPGPSGVCVPGKEGDRMIHYRVTLEPETIPVRGNAVCSDDPEYDRGMVQARCAEAGS